MTTVMEPSIGMKPSVLIPTIGYRNENGIMVLPAEEDCPEDDEIWGNVDV